MTTTINLQVAAAVAREKLEAGDLDRELLAKLYRKYADVGETRRFVARALTMFPRLSCGLASVYLRHCLGEGTIVRGRYGSHNHTFMLLNNMIVDITADQYGGPRIYIGTIQPPWSLKRRQAA